MLSDLWPVRLLRAVPNSDDPYDIALNAVEEPIGSHDDLAVRKIEKLWNEDAGVRGLAAAWFAGFDGLVACDLIRDAGLAPEQAETFAHHGQLVELSFGHRRVLLHPDRSTELETRILEALAELHTHNPLATNHDRLKLSLKLDYIGTPDLIQAAVGRLLAAKKVVGDSRRIARADFKPKLSANQRKLKDRIVEAHAAAGCLPPEPKEFANQAGGNAAALHDIFEVAVAEGLLVKVTEELFLHADVEAAMRRTVIERLKLVPGATVAEIRDWLGTTRKFAVPLCEYLDRIGVTQRAGDIRTATNR